MTIGTYTAECGVCHCGVGGDFADEIAHWLTNHQCKPRTIPVVVESNPEWLDTIVGSGGPKKKRWWRL